jgi:hypothetical protein
LKEVQPEFVNQHGAIEEALTISDMLLSLMKDADKIVIIRDGLRFTVESTCEELCDR